MKQRNKQLLCSLIYGIGYACLMLVGIVYIFFSLKKYPEDLVLAMVFSYLLLVLAFVVVIVCLNFIAWYFRLKWMRIVMIILLVLLLIVNAMVIPLSFIFNVIWITLVIVSFAFETEN